MLKPLQQKHPVGRPADPEILFQDNTRKPSRKVLIKTLGMQKWLY